MQKPDVLIYQDYVHNNGQLYAALVKKFGHERVGFCDADDILSGILTAKICLFVMPGGADLYYCEKLNGEGNIRIRRYVEQGGSYLGICAGAYYGCASLKWATGTEQDISGPRELKFYDGEAIGPIDEFLQDQDITKSWIYPATLHYADGAVSITTKTHYEGGPVFENGRAKILACYDDERAAIVEMNIGLGRVILSSSHIECTGPLSTKSHYQNNNANKAYEQSMIAQLLVNAESQLTLWNTVLDRLTAKLANREQDNVA